MDSLKFEGNDEIVDENNENVNAQNNEKTSNAKKTFVNEETDTVAMVDELMQAIPPKTTTINVPIQKADVPLIATDNADNTQTTTKTIAQFAIPTLPALTLAATSTSTPASSSASKPKKATIPTPQLSGAATIVTTGISKNNNNNNANTNTNSSLKKKKHNKSATKRSGNEIGDKSEEDGGSAANVVGCGNSGVTGSSEVVAVVVASNIKTSLSMTSLPPDDEKQESRDVIKAKLRVERPYNSLKKNSDRNIGINPANFILSSGSGNGNGSGCSYKQHRYSWGSGHSQSSSSLHSNAALALGSGKDDLWAAIQTNYNYIMDTNLLDSCREARCELEGAADVMENTTEQCSKMLNETQVSESSFEDLKELRKWLREMENKLENAPTISQATLLSTSELQRNLSCHSVLYHEIVSHARVVNACIRAASEREQQQERNKKESQSTIQENSNSCSISEQNNSSLSSTDETISTDNTTATVTADSTATTYTTTLTTTTTTTASGSSGIGTGEGKSTLSVTSPVSSTTSSKKSEGNFERLQNRYHLLYLKAFEVQLWLDGLLRKKTSSTNQLNEGTDNEDDEENSSECGDVNDVCLVGNASEDDSNNVVSELESDANDRSSSIGELQVYCTENSHVSDVQQFGSSPSKAYYEDGDDEEDEDDDEDIVDGHNCQKEWFNLGYNNVLHTCDRSGNFIRAPTTTLSDFEADSESSDFEVVLKLRHQRKISNCNNHNNHNNQKQPVAFASAIVEASVITAPPTKINHTTHVANLNKSNAQLIAAVNVDDTRNSTVNIDCKNCTTPLKTEMNSNNLVHEQRSAIGRLSDNIKSTPILPSCVSAATQTSPKLQTINSDNNCENNSSSNSHGQNCGSTSININVGNSGSSNSNSSRLSITPTMQKSVAIISPNNHHNSKTRSPSVLRKRQQQQRHNDISKFNRSNRKSKNCAIFYFKHLDTDTETNYSAEAGGGDHCLSSATSQASLIKSAEASSDDDEGWLYSTTATSTANDSRSNDCLNSTKISNNIIAGLVVDGLQSQTVSSSTTTSSATASVLIISDDSDKENKRELAAAATNAVVAVASTTIVPNTPKNILNTQIAIDANQSGEVSLISPSKATTSTPTAAVTKCDKYKCRSVCCEAKNYSSGGSVSGSGSGSGRGSSCSSNDLLTETTTSATTTTQVTQMLGQRVLHHRTEMELQVNGSSSSSNGDNKKSHCNISKHDCVVNNNDININGNPSVTSRTVGKNLNVQQQQQQHLYSEDPNENMLKEKLRFYTSADVYNVSIRSYEDGKASNIQSPQLLLNPGKRLPPRSPAKSGKSQKSNKSISASNKAKVSHESIKQLVLEAEHLVCEEAHSLKTPTNQKYFLVKNSGTVKKRDGSMSGPIKQRVEDWLAHQTPSQVQLSKSHDVLIGAGSSIRTDGCEASGEASESDSMPQPGSDSSEGFTDSVATCMQTSTNSYGNSTERIGGSAEPINASNSATVLGYGSSNQSLNMGKIIKRPQSRRKSERPWSVSCLSQLTTDGKQAATDMCTATNDMQTGLATHSISESALDSLSPGRPRVGASSSTSHVVSSQVKNCDSKGSLRRRRTRKKKHSLTAPCLASKISDSGSEENAEMINLTQTMLMKSCESMSSKQIQEITTALMSLQKTAMVTASSEQLTVAPATVLLHQPQQHGHEGEETGDDHLMKPNFRVGSYTTAYMRSEARLGSLAALSTYMHDDEQQGEYTTGTEDHHSSISETAWDNYQEKYNSENYSEGLDSDAARRLTDFGDDYRNFIDSQSDCCSSLSAANNLDSLSPPRMDSLQQNENKIITQDTIVSSVDHARRRRALELSDERRRKTLEVRRKSCQDLGDNLRSSLSLSASANALTLKHSAEKYGSASSSGQQKSDSTSRKLEFSGMSHSAQSLRRTSESDTSTRRRKADERRRSSRNLEKCIKPIPATSSSSCEDSDDEKEMRNLLQQSRCRLDDTGALKIRCHLLKPEDYNEIINTCRDNIHCLEAVLRGPPGTVLSTQCVSQTKDLLAAWEDLLSWSENAAAARRIQEEMIKLKHALNRLGNKSMYEQLDTEPSIQIAIDALKDEKAQLQAYRTNMLRLNASVHSWLTKQERKLQTALVEEQLKEAAATENMNAEPNQQQEITLHTGFKSGQQQQYAQLRGTATKTTTAIATTMIIDGNGNELERQTETQTQTQANEINEIGGNIKTACVSTGTIATPTKSALGSNKAWDLQTLISSENEFHKHLKDEVSDMYSVWDEADTRINTQLEMLTNSLLAWQQLECGLSEFQHALGQDRGTLIGLEGALSRGQASPLELAQNVKLVAKLLSEKVNVSQEQLTAVQEHLDPNHILHIAKFTASNGSLSDSGISDGGTTSDGGLSERERRLGVLRRLVKQLESALAPGSEAMKSIAVRMESAEAELKYLQNTCRDLIVRTAATHQSKKQQLLELESQHKREQEAAAAALLKNNSNSSYLNANGKASDKQLQQKKQQQQQHQKQNTTSQNSPSKRKNKRSQNKLSTKSSTEALNVSSTESDAILGKDDKDASDVLLDSSKMMIGGDPDSGDPSDDPSLSSDLESADDESSKKGWAWRIAKIALPMQLALLTFLCAACLMQPNCCDNLNNLSMSFTPQLRYIRGPPPI